MLERLKQYIDYKGISVSAFERSIGMANASFGKSLKTHGTIGANKIEVILREYPDLNPLWLVSGKGSMINTYKQEPEEYPVVNEPEISYEKPSVSALQQKIIQLQDERIRDMTRILELEKRINSLQIEISSLKK